MGLATLAPHTITQVQVVVPTPISRSRTGHQDLVIQHGTSTNQNRAERGSSHGRVRHSRTRNGLVEREARHLTDKECQQLWTAMAARRHLFATGKGYLGRTNRHQTYTKYTRATSQRLNNEFDATQRPAGRRKGSSLKTCWLSGLSKRATVRRAVRPSW